jgi:predicted dehydrogenase
MGRSHALAYHKLPEFDVIGLVNRGPVSLPPELGAYRMIGSFEDGLAEQPDVVSINTYTDTHADLAIRAMEAGAHVFVEKPLALTLESARAVIDAARRTGRKLVIGYILRHHPSWNELIKAARELGGPFVMRMNLNQPSTGPAWEVHKRLLNTTPPIVDCGVHYVDIMCQITDAKPTQVRGMGVRLARDIPDGQVNYGQLQVLFDDGSVGWYEAGWGPMISRTACFVKDVIGARGSVSLVMGEDVDSASIESHTQAGQLRVRALEFTGAAVQGTTEALIPLHDDVDHQVLCDREQMFLLQAIRSDLDLTRHHEDAIRSLEIVLAAEQSMRERRAVDL